MNNTRTLTLACLAATALLGGCAQIAATDAALPAPALSVVLSATASNGVLSTIPGGITVQSAALRHFTSAAPPPAFANAGTNGQTVTFKFSGAPEFVNGDVLTVSWSAEAVSILGSHYTLQKIATYSFHGRVGK